MFSLIRGSFPNKPHPSRSISLKCNSTRFMASICERTALLLRWYTLKDLPLTVDEDSNRTKPYYIIFSLVILIRLEVATTITRILYSPQALRFISLSNVQITA